MRLSNYDPAETKEISENWILIYAETVNLGYTELMEGAADYLETGSYLSKGGDLEGVDLPAEFWDHYEIATGTKVPPKKRMHFFSCAC